MISDGLESPRYQLRLSYNCALVADASYVILPLSPLSDVTPVLMSEYVPFLFLLFLPLSSTGFP